MIVAVDGPAASGKGTLARALARHYGLHYLDTGSLYRAVGQAVLAAGGDPADEKAARAVAEALDAARIDEKAIRTAEADHAASVVAAMPAVRAAILDLQRRFAAQKPGAVLDGRDIGTVVCPDADVKLSSRPAPKSGRTGAGSSSTIRGRVLPRHKSLKMFGKETAVTPSGRPAP